MRIQGVIECGPDVIVLGSSKAITKCDVCVCCTTVPRPRQFDGNLCPAGQQLTRGSRAGGIFATIEAFLHIKYSEIVLVGRKAAVSTLYERGQQLVVNQQCPLPMPRGCTLTLPLPHDALSVAAE